MKLYNLLIIAFISYLLPCMLYAGTAYYVDPSAGTNGNGTYASPWNNIPSVNNHSMQTGDDVFFRVNTIYTLTADSDRLRVDWSGTSGDRVVIGAYYGDGQFGLNGNARPIIDGNTDDNTANGGESPGNYQGLIEVRGGSLAYITVTDLKVQYSGYYGIAVQSADNINVDNCHIYRDQEAGGITYLAGGGDGVNTGIISNNIVQNCGYPNYSGGGAAIEISAGNSEGTTTNITVQYNKVFSSKLEGIGLYKKVTNSIVEYNTVYDIRTFHIYLGSSKYNIVRFNLVYNLDDAEKTFPGSGGGYGIAIDNEAWKTYCYSGNNEIYNNIIAGQHIGISLGCQITYCTGVGVPSAECKGDFSEHNCFDDTKIYNNTIVDNEYNFRFWNPSSSDSVEIKNNISWTITSGTHHAVNYNPVGVAWSHNLFDDNVTGNAATNAVFGDPGLSKTSGWRFLTAGNVIGSEFALTAASDAVDAGVSIAGYNDRITSADFTAHPISVTTALDNIPDIGAWKYNNGDTTPPAKPTGLNIID